jgi:uncharacterized membrane protein YoaK (UPF0700 family)
MSEAEAFARLGPLEPPEAVSVRHPLVRALLGLTFTTGLVDASSYVGLGHVFTANQAGNVVLLAAGIAGSGNLPVAAPLVSLGSFLVGAGAAGVVTKRSGRRHRIHVGRALAAEMSLLGTAAILAAAVTVTPGAASGYTVIALLALAMGVRNGTLARFGGADSTLTMLTGSLAALASNLPFTGGSHKGSVRRGAATLALFAGALAGAMLLKTSLWLPLAAAATLALAISSVLRTHDMPTRVSSAEPGAPRRPN